jgi:ceramide glucosyltransferase
LLTQSIFDGALGLSLFGLFTSTVYSGLVLAGARRFRQPFGCSACAVSSAPSCIIAPPVSVLKPLHGVEPGLEEHLAGFFRQDYSDYEILFCARSAEDAGLQVARRVAARYPEVKARFLTTGEPPYANAKVASLAVMAKAAANDLLVISDSDVRVEANYLREVVRPFADPMVGAVTCLYRGTVLDRKTGLDSENGRVNSLWARLEGVGMSIEMTAGVLVANLVEGMQFVLGPTMAMRRECVEAIGGFDSLGQYCSDDFLLGQRIAGLGFDVVLSRHVIDHVILNDGFAESMKHQARWMKSTRFSRPKGHLGTALIFSTPYALLASLLLFARGHAWLALAAIVWGVGSRMAMAAIVGRTVVAERQLLRTVLLYPLRDLMGLGFWTASYASNRILWRGEVFALMKDGLMRPLHAASSKNAAGGHTKEREPILSA